jgi:TRAP-type C4-dicarboxylate transport system permease small subunit
VAEPIGGIRRPADPLGRVLFALASAWAVAGGLALIALGLLTTANVLLKDLFGRPIRGEFEIVDLGVVMVVFTFMPVTQLMRGNVIVDLFTQAASAKVRAALDALAGLVFALCVALVAWRMTVGGIELAGTGEQTTVLHLKYWWAFVVAVPSLALLAANCLYTAWTDLRLLRQ